jgi:hypothetical protein
MQQQPAQFLFQSEEVTELKAENQALKLRVANLEESFKVMLAIFTQMGVSATEIKTAKDLVRRGVVPKFNLPVLLTSFEVFASSSPTAPQLAFSQPVFPQHAFSQQVFPHQAFPQDVSVSPANSQHHQQYQQPQQYHQQHHQQHEQHEQHHQHHQHQAPLKKESLAGEPAGEVVYPLSQTSRESSQSLTSSLCLID